MVMMVSRVAALVAVGFLLACVSVSAAVPNWALVDQVLLAGVQDGAYPGCVALVGNKDVRTTAAPSLVLTFAFSVDSRYALPPPPHITSPMD
jgi:hypothetical protein